MSAAMLQALPLAAATLKARQARTRPERDAAMADVRLFARHCRVQDADGVEIDFGKVGWAWQFVLIAVWALTKMSVVLKARQLGVSWLAAIFALWTAIRRPGQSVLFISRRQEDADKLLEKVAYVYDRLPAWRPRANVNTRSISFPGIGSEIESLPAHADIGRSRTANLVVLDEHAHQPFARKILQAVLAAAEQGKILSISSANGQGALHSQLFINGHRGQPLEPMALDDGTRLPLQITRNPGPNGWRSIFVPFNAHPERDAAWRIRARAAAEQLSDAEFAQEYPADPVEAITMTGRPVFRAEDIHRQVLEPGTTGETGLVSYRPPEAGKVYVIGADVGEGLATSDWSSATVLERDSGEQMAQLRGRWAPDVYAAKLDRLARLYASKADPGHPHPVIVAVERNNHGHAVLLRLIQLHGSVAPYTIAHLVGTGVKKRAGWLTTSANRPVLVDQLEAALRTGAIRLHDASTVDQLSFFHYNDDGRPEATEGYHDDDVFALGIAWQVRRRAFGRVLDIRRPTAVAA